MTDYIFLQATTRSWGSAWGGSAYGTIHGETADFTLVDYSDSYIPFFDPTTPWMYDGDIVSSLIGFRLDFTITSGESDIEILITADNSGGGGYSSSTNMDMGFNPYHYAPGSYSHEIGAEPFVFGSTMRWYTGGAISVQEVVRRAKDPSYEHLYGEFARSATEGDPPISITGFKLVAFTAEVSPTVTPPLRQVKRGDGLGLSGTRRATKHKSRQSSARRAGGFL